MDESIRLLLPLIDGTRSVASLIKLLEDRGLTATDAASHLLQNLTAFALLRK